MRRTDREITNRKEIVDVLNRSDTIRLGIHGDPYPYVVPLSFGWEDTGNEIHIYFHGANEGFKHALLEHNNHVCVEADIFHKYITTDVSLSAEYESVIGFGTAEIVEGDEAAKAMALVCDHCGYPGFVCETIPLETMKIYRITLSSITGKRRL